MLEIAGTDLIDSTVLLQLAINLTQQVSAHSAKKVVLKVIVWLASHVLPYLSVRILAISVTVGRL